MFLVFIFIEFDPKLHIYQWSGKININKKLIKLTDALNFSVSNSKPVHLPGTRERPLAVAKLAKLELTTTLLIPLGAIGSDDDDDDDEGEFFVEFRPTPRPTPREIPIIEIPKITPIMTNIGDGNLKNVKLK